MGKLKTRGTGLLPINSPLVTAMEFGHQFRPSVVMRDGVSIPGKFVFVAKPLRAGRAFARRHPPWRPAHRRARRTGRRTSRAAPPPRRPDDAAGAVRHVVRGAISAFHRPARGPAQTRGVPGTGCRPQASAQRTAGKAHRLGLEGWSELPIRSPTAPLMRDDLAIFCQTI
jgi:hypothetical protein